MQNPSFKVPDDRALNNYYLLPNYFLMGVTIAISFNSWRLTEIAGCVAFLSAGMVLGSLSLFGYSRILKLGTTALIEIAVNDSIVILAAM